MSNTTQTITYTTTTTHPKAIEHPELEPIYITTVCGIHPLVLIFLPLVIVIVIAYIRDIFNIEYKLYCWRCKREFKRHQIAYAIELRERKAEYIKWKESRRRD